MKMGTPNVWLLRVSRKASPSLEKQMAEIYSPVVKDGMLPVTMIPFQQQVGGTDLWSLHYCSSVQRCLWRSNHIWWPLMQMKCEDTLNDALKMKSLHLFPPQRCLFRNVGGSMCSFMLTVYVDFLKVMTLRWLSVNSARSGSTLSAWSLWLNQTPGSAHSVCDSST